MRIPVQISRVFTALLFVFSGMVKLNDPSGFAIKLNEYWDVFASDVSQKQDSIHIQLLDGAKIVQQTSFLLFSADKSQTLNIHVGSDPVKSEDSSANADTTDQDAKSENMVLTKKKSKPRKTYDLKLTATYKDLPAGEMAFKTQDSGVKSMVVVRCVVAGKTIYQKDIHFESSNSTDFKNDLQLENYVKKEGALHGFFLSMKKYSLYFSVIFCALEVILGFALLVGWRITFTSVSMLLLIVFFTFLTGYSWIYNKVTDCGCFGDFIKLKPKESFIKDLVLSGLILIIVFGRSYIKPWFSKGFGWKFMGGITLLSFAFGWLCYLYLPIWDFLPYKPGNDIHKIMTEVPKGMRASDSIQMLFVLEKGKDSVSVTTKEYTDGYEKFAKEGWKFRRRIDKVIIEGYKSPIHDFAISDPRTGTDLKDSFIHSKGYKLLWVFTYTDKGYNGANPEISEIYTWSKQNKIAFYPVTASSAEPSATYVKEQKLPFAFLSADQKMLMTLARYNPTLYLFKDAVVVDKWSGRNLPSTQKLQKITSK
jgi:uncharacterized membrane protein YphA (DoxX/SURF4 family)